MFIVRITCDKLSSLTKSWTTNQWLVLYCKRWMSRDLQVARPCRSRCSSLVSVASLAWCWGELAVPYIQRWYWNHEAVVFSSVATSTMIRGPTNTSCTLNYLSSKRMSEQRYSCPTEWVQFERTVRVLEGRAKCWSSQKVWGTR